MNIGSIFNFFVLLLVGEVFSLRCYQTNKETKETFEVENDDFVFCSVFPSLPDTRHFSHSVSDGLTADELDKPLGKLYEDNDQVYQMISTCMFEKYDWPKLWNPKFNKAKKAPEIEYALRCVCNTDLCNSPSSFTSFINQWVEVA